jgi:hypothetical protein
MGGNQRRALPLASTLVINHQARVRAGSLSRAAELIGHRSKRPPISGIRHLTQAESYRVLRAEGPNGPTTLA